MADERIIVEARIVVSPDKADGFAAIAADLVRGGSGDAGCIVYRIARDVVDPTNYFVYEEWSSSAALEAHASTPEAQETVARAAEVGVIGFFRSSYSATRLPEAS